MTQPNEGGNAESTHLDRVVTLTAAYVAGNTVRAGELGEIVALFATALRGLDAPIVPEVIPEEPKVSIKKSITPDYLICLDDGMRFKSLKRHLSTLGMTPDEYRAKWGLDKDYPMVAPSYSEARSTLAKTAGLGRKRSDETVAPAVAETPAAAVAETSAPVTETVAETPAPKAPKGKKAAKETVEA
jgi:predicted transcriptional regulator